VCAVAKASKWRIRLVIYAESHSLALLIPIKNQYVLHMFFYRVAMRLLRSSNA